jgi:hypothetical protein
MTTTSTNWEGTNAWEIPGNEMIFTEKIEKELI